MRPIKRRHQRPVLTQLAISPTKMQLRDRERSPAAPMLRVGKSTAGPAEPFVLRAADPYPFTALAHDAGLELRIIRASALRRTEPEIPLALHSIRFLVLLHQLRSSPDCLAIDGPAEVTFDHTLGHRGVAG